MAQSLEHSATTALDVAVDFLILQLTLFSFSRLKLKESRSGYIIQVKII